MTHDELLAKIDKIKPLNSPAWNMQNALRAVVELHKPYDDESTLMCSYCDWNSYPCGTIEAIQKELA